MTGKESAQWISERLTKKGISRNELRSQFPGTDEEWIIGLNIVNPSRRPGGMLSK